MKALFFVVVVLFLIPAAESQFRTSIYDYLKHVDEHYVIVVGKDGKSWDSIAATKLALGFLRNNYVDVQVVVESAAIRNINKILIGHPCDLELITALSCADWPFKDGEAIVKLDGSDLILSGTDSEGVVRAAELLAAYKEKNDLKKYTYALITDSGIYGLKEAFQMECGDTLCERGEQAFCPLDCELITCAAKCAELDFPGSVCAEETTHPSLPSCAEGALEAGKGYCADKKICCCVPETVQPPDEGKPVVQPPPPEPVVVEKQQPIVTKETVTENIGAILTFGVLLLIVVVLVVIYRRVSHSSSEGEK